MNAFDIVVCIPLFWGIYKGYQRGILLELAGIVGLLIGIYCAVKFSSVTASFIDEKTEWDPMYIKFTAFALTFILVGVGIFFFTKFLTKITEKMGLSIPNKVSGAIFGIFKVALIVSVVIYLFNLVDKEQQVFTKELRQNSFFYPPMASVAPFIFNGLKENKVVEDLLDEPVLNKTGNDSTAP